MLHILTVVKVLFFTAVSTGESEWPGGGRCGAGGDLCQDMPWRIVIINTNQSDWIYESQLNQPKQVSHRPGCGDKDNGNVEIQLKSVGPVLTATATASVRP